jgi:glutathione S-transferase
VILYYLDEVFPETPLMPVAPLARAKAPLFNKLIDEYVHNSCTILTFATAFRPGLLKMRPEEREAGFAKAPSKQRSAYKRDVVARGLDSRFVKDAVEHYERLLTWINDAMKGAPYLAGDTYSLADVAVIPYILRHILRPELLRLSRMWDRRPSVAAWWERVRQRSSTNTAIFKRMTDADAAPFKNLLRTRGPRCRKCCSPLRNRSAAPYRIVPSICSQASLPGSR